MREVEAEEPVAGEGVEDCAGVLEAVEVAVAAPVDAGTIVGVLRVTGVGWGRGIVGV